MPTCAAPQKRVEAPAVDPVLYGLFTVSDVSSFDDLHEANGVEWQPLACERATPEGCACGPIDKTFREGEGFVRTDPFFVYGTASCVGDFGLDELPDRARQHLLLGEERAVEHALMTGLSTPGFRSTTDSPVTNLTPEATGLDDGEALSFVAAWATLEEQLGEGYAGRGVIHAPKAAAIYAAANQLVCGGCTEAPSLVSVLGTHVSAGGGYAANTGPGGTAAPAGEVWLYATGRPQIRRGEILQRTDLAETLDRNTNRNIGLAERLYTIGFDCPTIAVRAKLTCP